MGLRWVDVKGECASRTSGKVLGSQKEDACWGVDKQAWKVGTLVFFRLHWVFVAALRLSLVALSRGSSLL